jgi:hypothetical protein
VKSALAFRKTRKLLQRNLHLVGVIEKNSFRYVRPGYAIWHLCKISKGPISLDRIATALVEGNVITSLDEDSLKKSAYRLAEYHTRSGKLRRVGTLYTAR